MANVRFDSGVEALNSNLNGSVNLGFLFSAITAKHVFNERGTRTPGHAIVFPSNIDVTLFTDLENNFGYAINTSIELDAGRMKISDFVVRHAWTEIDGENKLELLNESGDSLVQLDTNTATMLSLLAESYRLAHLDTFRQ